MAIVVAFDRHREQIAFDALETATGEVSRGRIRPADRLGFRRWLCRWEGQRVEAVLEATTGWRFMVEELRAVGAEVHLAEPAETSALRGPKKRAKTHRQDARRLRELLQAGRVPESWIAPEWILELRSKVRLRHTPSDERGEWQQRIQAQLYHHDVQRRQLLVGERRAWLEALELPDAARRQIRVASALIDAIDAQLEPLDRELRALARRQPGCRALLAHYGIGALTAVAILAELDDARRFSSSRQAVRYAGLDVTVSYGESKQRLGANRACLAIARKLLKRSYHSLRELGAPTGLANRMRARARHQAILRGRLRACSRRHGNALDGPERQSGRTRSPSGDTPSTIMSPAPQGPRTEKRLGARAHRSCHPLPRAHAPPRHKAVQPIKPDIALTAGSLDR